MTHPSIHARTQPDKIAYQVAGSGKAISYRELDELSNQGAHLFRSLGLKAGDHIAITLGATSIIMEFFDAEEFLRLVSPFERLPS
jgi:long-chain acyl-CoA synthetase